MGVNLVAYLFARLLRIDGGRHNILIIVVIALPSCLYNLVELFYNDGNKKADPQSR